MIYRRKIMRVIKNILKALFVLAIIINSMNVYGYNLKYKGYTISIGGNTSTEFKITTSAIAAQDTIDSYNARTSAPGEWIVAGPGDKDTAGGTRSWSSYYYAFHPINVQISDYNTGFNTSTSNDTNNNIYYDLNRTNAGVDLIIDAGFDSLNSFKGIAVNVPEDQGDSTSGHDYVKFLKNAGDGYVTLLCWKVINGVDISVYKISDAAVEILKGKFGPEVLNSGIRFSNGLRTQDERFPGTFFKANQHDLDSTWKYFQATIGKWNSGGRGFDNENTWRAYDTSTHKAGASVANEFDNILYLPVSIKKATRDIYVNHVDEAGNIINLPGFSYGSLPMVTPAGEIRSNVEPRRTFQEHYTIYEGETIPIKKSTITENAGYIYTFTGAKYSISTNFDTAKASLPVSSNRWSDSPHNVSTSASKDDDFMVINLIYHITPPPVKELPDLEIIGRLAFINRDPAYLGSTSGHELDYIPSTKALTPYAQAAYPYVVRALRYELKTTTSTISTTSTANITYSWDIWTYSHGSAVEIDKPAVAASAGPPAVAGSAATYKHKHDSTCDWYLTGSSATSNKVFNYTVPYKHTWYQIVNFKMYRISLFEVYDTNSDIGGELFDGGTYTVYPSATYESRFNNSRGRVPKTLTVTFPSKSYILPSVSVALAKPTGGTSTASGTSYNSSVAAAALATTKLGAETHVTASNTHTNSPELRISYVYDNDFVELDGVTDMLQRNNKTWSERISKETDAANIRDLDSTKTVNGSDQYNGSLISYTSNLMSYMRPSTRLTTDYDFANNYRTVPATRENGLRKLSAKIFYKISTDSKYNVGTNNFDSTDANYILNNGIRLTGLDFADYDKVYANNDVNKVTVLTPINFASFELITDKKVDHSDGAGSSAILQKNANFTITPNIAGSTTGGYNIGNTREFVRGYYFIFNFNIIYNGTLLHAYDPIYIAGANASITAKTTDSFASGSADQITNSIKIVAITTNITDALKNYFDAATFSNYSYMDYYNNKVRTSITQNQPNFLSRPDIASDAYHSIYKIITTRNIGRIFDFAITDCTDLAFKDTFRQVNGTNVNESAKISYYSGYKYWNLYSDEYNEILDRTDVGSNPQKTLPLGPYKNTNTKYINAPKMGYRISFDLKTTGFMAANNANDTRRIEITPRYYYISKDGKTFDNNSNTSLKLYYKNSNGKYVEFASSGYTIYFKPNDGYRYLRNSIYTNVYGSMSTKLEPLTISNKIILTNDMMCTNNTSFIQSWYGEFKLPNSTIAVSSIVGNPNNNINNPYKDGYIGVIFDIKCIDTGGFIISYDTSDKSAASSANTSQWDYEGFMNFKTPGSAAGTIRYQLEKDMWQIDNSRYQQIKGTVVLYDLDNRAANDFE
jgi:hypothetical protein